MSARRSSACDSGLCSSCPSPATGFSLDSLSGRSIIITPAAPAVEGAAAMGLAAAFASPARMLSQLSLAFTSFIAILASTGKPIGAWRRRHGHVGLVPHPVAQDDRRASRCPATSSPRNRCRHAHHAIRLSGRRTVPSRVRPATSLLVITYIVRSYFSAIGQPPPRPGGGPGGVGDEIGVADGRWRGCGAAAAGTQACRLLGGEALAASPSPPVGVPARLVERREAQAVCSHFGSAAARSDGDSTIM